MISAQTLQKEELLVIAYQRTKCNKAFGKLYELFYSQLFDYVNKISKNSDDAFDITQEAFIKAAQEIDNLRVPITFRFWLFRIAKHLCMKKFKKMTKEAVDCYENDDIAQDYSTADAIEKDIQLEKMSKVLATLTPEEQLLLLHKYANGKSIKEIMEETSLGSSAIKMKLMRARTKVMNGMAKVS